MSRYRIVARNGRTVSKFYYAQRKWFGLFWLDLRYASSSGYGKWPNGSENPSININLVENFIEMYRDDLDRTTKVIKEFD
jgi:hypothetical protein